MRKNALDIFCSLYMITYRYFMILELNISEKVYYGIGLNENINFSYCFNQ